MTSLHLSTGQTVEDLIGLAKIANIMDSYTNFTPPALQDKDYKPPKNTKGLVAMAIITMLVSVFMVSFRIVMTQRTRKVRLPYIEDVFIIFGLIIVCALCIFSLVGVYKHQWGWHTYDLHLENLVYNYKMWYIWFVMNVWASFTIRASLIFTIRRLYSPLKTTMIRICDLALCLKLVLAVTGTFLMTFTCGDHMEITDVWKYTRSCNPFVVTLCVCVISISMDLAIITLPMPLVGMLVSVTRRKKLEVVIIFSFGFLAVAASVVRVCEVSRYLHSVDRNWTASTLAITSLLELCLTIATSCIPSARVLFSRIYAAESLLTLRTYFTPAGQNPFIDRSSTGTRTRLRKMRTSSTGAATGEKKRMKKKSATKEKKSKPPKAPKPPKEKKQRLPKPARKPSRKFSAASSASGISAISGVSEGADFSENADTFKSGFSDFSIMSKPFGEGSKPQYAQYPEKYLEASIQSSILPDPPSTAVLRDHHPNNPFYDAMYNVRESRKPSLTELRGLQQHFLHRHQSVPSSSSYRPAQNFQRTATPETFLASDSESDDDSLDGISTVNTIETTLTESAANSDDSGEEFEGYDVDMEGHHYEYDGDGVGYGSQGGPRIPEPSDSFFPWATALSPRPAKRRSVLGIRRS